MKDMFADYRLLNGPNRVASAALLISVCLIELEICDFLLVRNHGILS